MAVCRQMVVALEEGGFRTTYVNVSEGVRAGRFAAVAAAWNARRTSSRMGPVDVAISNGPIRIGVRGEIGPHVPRDIRRASGRDPLGDLPAGCVEDAGFRRRPTGTASGSRQGVPGELRPDRS